MLNTLLRFFVISLIGLCITSNAHSLTSEEAATAATIQQAIDKQREDDKKQIENAKNQLENDARQAERSRDYDEQAANLRDGDVNLIALFLGGVVLPLVLAFGLGLVGNFVGSGSDRGFFIGALTGGLIVPIFLIAFALPRGYTSDIAITATSVLTYLVAFWRFRREIKLAI